MLSIRLAAWRRAAELLPFTRRRRPAAARGPGARRRAVAVVLALTPLSAVAVGVSPGGVAYAGGQIADPAEWTTFLANHAEATSGTGLSTAVALCEFAPTCVAGAAVG